jgi:hypothetical protein
MHGPCQSERSSKLAYTFVSKTGLIFLGFCNFYCPFIYQFSHIARPLNELTRKDIPWTWELKHQEAFDELRK